MLKKVGKRGGKTNLTVLQLEVRGYADGLPLAPPYGSLL